MSWPVLSALRPVRGAGRLVGMRWLVAVVAGSFPGAVARYLLDAGPARSLPLHAPRPLPAFAALDMVEALLPIVPIAAAALVVAVVADSLLTAGAIAVVERSGYQDRFRDAFVPASLRYFWRFVRVSVVGGAWVALALLALAAATFWLMQRGHGAGWTARTIFVVLPTTAVLLGYGAVAVTGAWVLWVRVLMVVDERRGIWRTTLHVLRIWRRKPLTTVILYVVVTVGLHAVGAAALFAWRHSPPEGVAAPLATFALWLGHLGVVSFAWYWLVAAALRVYGTPDLDSVRAR